MTEGRSVRAASRLQCTKNLPRRASETADLAAFLWVGREVERSYMKLGDDAVIALHLILQVEQARRYERKCES